MKYQNHKKLSKRARRYFRKQKIYGVVLMAIGVLTTIVTEGDATVAVLLVPLGLYLVFTKSHVIDM